MGGIRKFGLGLAVILAGAGCMEAAEERSWTSKSGSSVMGKLVGTNNGSAVLRRSSDSSTLRIPVLELSMSDQVYLKKVLEDDEAVSELSAKVPKPLTSSLKAHYTFDAPSLVLTDSSGTQQRKKSESFRIGWERAGFVNGAASFDGRNSLCFLGRVIPMRNQPLTISCWIKTTCEDEQEIFTFGRGGTGARSTRNAAR